MSVDAAVQLQGVAKAYGRGDTIVHALRGVDLEVAPGELMMLVGPSGCGKTTLLSVAAGILDHDSGVCRIFGQDIGQLPDRELVRFRGRTLGFVFQSFNLVPTLTAAENVAVPLFLQGVARREAVRRATEMLDRVGLDGRGGSLPRELSGGQQQRVAIARAVIHRPRLVVCDEPTSALDQDTGHKVMELLRSLLLGDGRSLLVVTHDSRIFPFADRIAHMNDGRIERVDDARVAQGGPA